MDKFAGRTRRAFLAVFCSVILVSGPMPALQASASTQAATAQQPASRIPNDQLDSLVAPIALFPDPLLAQTLAASTYPLELIQLHQWLQKNKTLKDKALADAVAKQPWDPSVQAMAGLPDLVKRLADDIQWTTDLGNAFLAQQSDVMDAVQRMRSKAKDSGNLKSSEEIKVETKVVESKTVVVIEQANPQVIYVPTYNPTVVYGVPIYPYPPIYYPPPYYGAIAFSAGVFMGAAMWGGGGNIYINNNNNFNRINHFQGGNRNNIGSGNIGSGNSNWQHRPEHRGGTPYSDRATADKFGGNARGDSLSNRQSGARQQLGSQGGNLSSQRASGAGNTSLGNRTGSAAPSVSNRSSGINSSGTNRSGSSLSSGSANRVGTRDMSRSAGSSSSRSAFGGGSGGYSGSSARSSSARGSGSMRGGGGGRRR